MFVFGQQNRLLFVYNPSQNLLAGIQVTQTRFLDNLWCRNKGTYISGQSG